MVREREEKKEGEEEEKKDKEEDKGGGGMNGIRVEKTRRGVAKVGVRVKIVKVK
jgi:hypothetical protein